MGRHHVGGRCRVAHDLCQPLRPGLVRPRRPRRAARRGREARPGGCTRAFTGTGRRPALAPGLRLPRPASPGPDRCGRGDGVGLDAVERHRRGDGGSARVGMTFHDGLIDCRLCPRLVEWRERKATSEKRAAFSDEEYWGRPVPSLGPSDARILIIGLAPAAHGANRTGQMFTGERSGEWLYRSLHRAGLATSPDHLDPDLRLIDTRITAICHCAPPDNRPTTEESRTCVETWLVPEVAHVDPAVVVCLGGLSWTWTLRIGPRLGWDVPRPRPRFGHGV